MNQRMNLKESKTEKSCSTAIKINQDYCSRCSICHSVCPYEAVKRDPETGKVEIEGAKCQVCGICYAACPVSAIEVVYYDDASLLKYVSDIHRKNGADTLVLMCRGNSPATGQIEQILEDQGLGFERYIPLRLPCSGRVPADFIFQAFGSGIRNVVSIQCEDSFCRFKEGTKVSTRRLLLSRAVLDQLGIDKNALRIVKFSPKPEYLTEECVGCDKCVFICPYDAIEAKAFSTPEIIKDRCVGCGACTLVCLHHALEMRGFEFENVLKSYTSAAMKLKELGKSPTILTFCCQWSEFPALQDPENLMFKKNTVIMEVPCFKALDPSHVINALQNGFDGVMGVACASEDCKLSEGMETAERNMDVLRRVLKKMDLLDRFEFFTVSPRQIGDFSQKLDDFSARIRTICQSQGISVGAKSHE